MPILRMGKSRASAILENVARLWICGMPNLPLFQDYSVTLSWQNTIGNPSVKLYWSCETNGGIGDLMNTNIAAQQVAVGLMSNFGTSMGNGFQRPCVCFI